MKPSWWNQFDMGSMLLGLYEAEVAGFIETLPESHHTLVNLGAGDGYYAASILNVFPDSRAYCFESSETGRIAIVSNVKLNGASDRVHVYGTATSEAVLSLRNVDGLDLSRCLLLVDIEGAEHSTLTEEVLNAFRGSFLVIEIHRIPDGDCGKLRHLIDRLGHWRTAILTTGARDPGALEATQHLGDDDLWALCSEGRAYRMQWLVCAPLTHE